MSTTSSSMLLHGAAAPAEPWREVRAGPVTAALDGVDLRYVRLGGVELVRRIYAAVRDRDWNTIPGVTTAFQLDERDGSFEARFTVRHENGDVDFTWEGTLSGSPEGRISFALAGRAGRDMLYNRIGFCVLHPPRESAGRPFRGRTPDGPVEGRLPELIGPQRFENGVYVPLFPSVDGLEIELDTGGRVRFDFEGDLWEMEDQRNWTDASFKTYCTPLARGFPHRLLAGQEIHQLITVSFEGVPAPAGWRRSAEPALEVGAELGRRLPPVGLGAASHGEPLGARELELLRLLRPDHLRVDVHVAEPGWPAVLERARAEAGELGCPLELALFLRAEQAAELDRLVEALHGTAVARVLVAVEGAETATPEETTPASLVAVAREHLGKALGNVPFAGGTDMFFTELNRTRPDAAALDAVFYSLIPQVHAFDDVSVVETLEAQAGTVATARSFAGGKPVIVSPITLKKRFNPWATGGESSEQEEGLPEAVDPRQLSLLGAAWTLGTVKYLAESGADSLTFFETSGWRGVVEREAGSPWPEEFPSGPGQAFPLFHVLADVGERENAELLECRSTDPLGVVGLALRDGGRTTLLVASVRPEPQTVRISGLEGPAQLRRLNEGAAGRAAERPEEFRGRVERAPDVSRLELAPYETVRIDV